MQEISLNILDIAQNSISAGANLIEISVLENSFQKTIEVVIKDNGCGMTEVQLLHVIDPFFTTRTTRKVGLGIPFFKMASEMTDGKFEINSKKGTGTTVRAIFHSDHIDCMPLGDILETIFYLITLNSSIDFVYKRGRDNNEFIVDTREFREILGDIPFNEPEVALFIKEYLIENSPGGEIN